MTKIQKCKFNKASQLASAIGTLDELNAAISLIRPYLSHSYDHDSLLSIGAIQAHLIDICSELFTKKKIINISHTTWINDKILCLKVGSDRQNFVIFQREPAVQYNFARVVCRRAERELIKLKKASPEILDYINKLSTLLFLMAWEAE